MREQIRIDETLWSGAMAPEGILERWFQPNGAIVLIGEKLAEVTIEGARHEVIAPASGRLAVLADEDAIVEPGVVIASIS